jgi:hypothetical protein
MMIEIGLQAPFGGPRPALFELIDANLDVQRQSFTAAEPVSFQVEAGSYLLRTHWSGGQRTEQVLRVDEDDVIVDMAPPSPLKESVIELGDPLLASRYRAGAAAKVAPDTLIYLESAPRSIHPSDSRDGLRNRPVLRPSAAPAGGDSGVGFSAMQHAMELDHLVDSEPEPTFTVWRKGSAGWVDAGLSVEAHPIHGGFEFAIGVDEGLHMFEVRSRQPSQYLSLPAETSMVALRWLTYGGSVYLRADVRSADPDVEALRGSIGRGELDIAKSVAESVMAERYLRHKGQAPRVAALGAYFLLRVGDLDRLHDWPDNLTKWKPWLPDGPVIAAWQRLRSDHPDYERIFALLTEAVRRGMPVYTEGVRLLKDGLDLFASDDQKTWNVDNARSRVEAYAQAMVWGKSETTFYGTAPDRPSPQLSHEQFVSSAEPAVWDAPLAADLFLGREGP